MPSRSASQTTRPTLPDSLNSRPLINNRCPALFAFVSHVKMAARDIGVFLMRTSLRGNDFRSRRRDLIVRNFVRAPRIGIAGNRAFRNNSKWFASTRRRS